MTTETWKRLDDWGVEISSHLRVRNIRTGKIIASRRKYATYGTARVYSVKCSHTGKWRNVTMAWLLREVLGARRTWRSWTEADDEAVRTLPPKEAARVTGRAPNTIYWRRYQMGWTKQPDQAGDVDFEAFMKELDAAARQFGAAANEVRSRVVLLRLEGYKGSVEAAIRRARKAMSREHYHGMRSLDATVPGTDRTYHETISAPESGAYALEIEP